MKYLALLRGINVGGKNIISKEELSRLFLDLGFKNVRTYIQSGNILFRSRKKSSMALAKSIEKELSIRFSYTARAVVLSYEQYKSAVESAPENWGKDDLYKHNALFLLGDTTPKKLSSGLMFTIVARKVIYVSVLKFSTAIFRNHYVILPSDSFASRNFSIFFILRPFFRSLWFHYKFSAVISLFTTSESCYHTYSNTISSLFVA